MEKLVCLFHQIGCSSGPEAWQRSQLEIFYNKHAITVWEWILPYVNVYSYNTRRLISDAYFGFAGMIYDGYWILFGLAWILILKFKRNRDPNITKKQVAWFIVKWSVIVSAVVFSGLVALMFASLVFCLP